VTAGAADGPALSVVVGLIAGRVDCLETCLEALSGQNGAVKLEILVPWDDPVAPVTGLAARFPAVRFLHAAGLDSAAARAGASREHHDTLRTIGLRAARGPVVALTEDHARVAGDWARALLDALERHPEAGAVGGAVDCDNDGALYRAVYYCDFGRYRNPLTEGPAWFVSDSNVAYRREALDLVADAWAGDYHETAVHDALVRAGRTLVLTPAAVVWQKRRGLTFGMALKERWVWARSYAGTRVHGRGLAARLPLAAGTPLLPFLLTWRIVRRAMHGGWGGEILPLVPLLLLLHTAWAAGECAGYLTGTP
jgi:GT2 family glycosyltransferase